MSKLLAVLLVLVLAFTSALTAIPDAKAFSRVGVLTLNTGENNAASAVIDVAAGFAYFGTSTSPGVIVKVRLSDFTEVGSLTLNAGDDYLHSAIIDTAAG